MDGALLEVKPTRVPGMPQAIGGCDSDLLRPFGWKRSAARVYRLLPTLAVIIW